MKQIKIRYSSRLIFCHVFKYSDLDRKDPNLEKLIPLTITH